MKRHYLSAIVAVAVALLLRYLLNPVLGQQGPYLILTLPIVAMALYGGFGPALLATALGTTAGTYLFIERAGGTRELLQPENVTRLMLFLAIGLAISAMGGQLRRSRNALAQKVQQLKAVNRAKDNAMAVLSHEIRNPLSAIHSAQTLLQRAPGDESRVSYASEVIARQVAQMTRMVEDLLDLSEVMREKPPAYSPVDLRRVLEQALEQCAPLCTKRHHHLSTVFGDEAFTVIGDAPRLVQVFANLLTNAAKYTDPGGEIALTVAPRPTRQVAVVIRDNGIGLAPDAIEELFEPFVRAPGAASNEEGGLGLGLAVVRKIVTDHGGDVAAESQGLGMGSQFTVVLPLANDRF